MLLFWEVSENFGEETIDALHAEVKSKKPKVSNIYNYLVASASLEVLIRV